MRIYDIISKKRDKQKLSKAEIDFFVEKYSKGEIPDYQAAALLMAIYINKMDKEETVYLTEAMMNSGDVIDLSDIGGIKVDKHSTGGVGDKTTIALAPLVAACGAPVAKMSGRGLGHTGGTLDKLEAIPGFSIEMDSKKFVDSVNEHKIAVCGQTASIAVADKKMYALRDVTATVDNISLIAASIMCKKLASGANAILLDVKTGDGAFMKTLDDSFELAKAMVDIGCGMNRETIGMITDMDEPLGFAVGNSLEVIEAIEILKGNINGALKDVSLALGSEMLVLGGIFENAEMAHKALEENINNHKGLEKFRELITLQGGNPSVIDDYSLFQQPKESLEVKAEKDGYISHIDTDNIGRASVATGAGRLTKTDKIDYSAGIIMKKKLGDTVKTGEVIATVYSATTEKCKRASEIIKQAVIIGEMPEKQPLIYKIIK